MIVPISSTHYSMITVQTSIRAALRVAWKAYTSPEDIVQWNFASDDWHCPSATNDLRAGGAFSYRMEARDGSMGFDFAGVYSRVIPLERIEYTFGGRKARVVFREVNSGVDVTVSFDSDGDHSEDMQRAGWQAILDNFRRHAESLPETGA